MFYMKTFWILILCVASVETTFVSDITCHTDDGNYTLTGVLGDGTDGHDVTSIFSTSGDNVCEHQLTGQILRIYGCFKANSRPAIDVYIRDGTYGLYIVGIQCDAAESRRRRQEKQFLSNFQYKKYDPEFGMTSFDRNIRRRRQLDPTDVAKDEEKIVSLETSVTFEVKLNFSSNDEISIVCDPDDTGMLYVSNPDPGAFRSLLVYSEHNKRKCKAVFLSWRRFVEVDSCNLNFPVIVAFSIREKHASVIGGTMAHFKVYKIDCTLPEIGQGKVFSYPYDSSADGYVNQFQVGLVTMVITVITLMDCFQILQYY